MYRCQHNQYTADRCIKESTELLPNSTYFCSDHFLEAIITYREELEADLREINLLELQTREE